MSACDLVTAQKPLCASETISWSGWPSWSLIACEKRRQRPLVSFGSCQRRSLRRVSVSLSAGATTMPSSSERFASGAARERAFASTWSAPKLRWHASEARGRLAVIPMLERDLRHP